MSNKINDPSFVKIFKNRESAKKALTILVTAKDSNFTNKQIMEIPFFKNLFDEDYLKFTNSNQLEWRMKNIARDLKKIPFDLLNNDWHEFKEFFEKTRRKSKLDFINKKEIINV